MRYAAFSSEASVPLLAQKQTFASSGLSWFFNPNRAGVGRKKFINLRVR